MLKFFDQGAGTALFGGEIEDSATGDLVEAGERDVLGDRKLEHQPLLLPVFGEKTEPCRDGGGGIVARNHPAAHPDRAGIHRIGAEDGTGELGAPGAHETRHAEDLTGANRQ